MIKIKILTPAFNCEKEIETTIYSVFGQTFKNWELLVIDDVSTDNTGQKVLDMAKSCGFDDRVFVKRREEKYGEVRNTVEECLDWDDDTVCVRLDAGDFLTDLGCFEILNALYERYDPAVLWTNQRWEFTDYSVCGPINPDISLYEQPWKSSHLKTFRVKDFKGINLKNYKDDEGNWLMIGGDQTSFLPMMERARRAGRPLLYFPKVMYHYAINLEDPQLFKSERSLWQKNSVERLRERGYIE